MNEKTRSTNIREQILSGEKNGSILFIKTVING
jgi:hypothetical protein